MSALCVITSSEVWRAARREQNWQTRWKTIPSGFPELDQCLPGGGWPLAAMTEVFIDEYGIGELSLFMPALARSAKHGLTWIAPPFMPYAPALARHGLDLRKVLLVRPDNAADVPWAIEQVLQAHSESTVLAWLTRAKQTVLRRLQLRIAAQRIWAVFFSPLAEASRRSPAALKMSLSRTSSSRGDVLHVDILKCRGGRPASVSLPIPGPIVHFGTAPGVASGTGSEASG